MTNLKQNIDSHNKSILHDKKDEQTKSCNYRKPSDCPLAGNCPKESQCEGNARTWRVFQRTKFKEQDDSFIYGKCAAFYRRNDRNVSRKSLQWFAKCYQTASSRRVEIEFMSREQIVSKLFYYIHQVTL